MAPESSWNLARGKTSDNAWSFSTNIIFSLHTEPQHFLRDIKHQAIKILSQEGRGCSPSQDLNCFNIAYSGAKKWDTGFVANMLHRQHTSVQTSVAPNIPQGKFKMKGLSLVYLRWSDYQVSFVKVLYLRKSIFRNKTESTHLNLKTQSPRSGLRCKSSGGPVSKTQV